MAPTLESFTLTSARRRCCAQTYMEEKFLQHAAPTLANIKPSNLFNIIHRQSDERKECLLALIALKEQLKPLHLRILILKHSAEQTQILLYRPKYLQKILSHPLCQDLLASYGYPSNNEGQVLAHLRKRFNSTKDFPHEIGLFLGYPPHDVKTFIDNLQGKTAQSVCTGSWKAYEKKDQALRCFNRYKQCTHYLCAKYREGVEFLDIVRCATKAKGSPLATEGLLAQTASVVSAAS